MFFAHLIGTFNALIVLETIRALKKGPLTRESLVVLCCFIQLIGNFLYSSNGSLR